MMCGGAGPVDDVPLIVILGPTGSGKSALSVAIAEAANGEVVNCDSVQVYKGFEIGAAKIPQGERRGVTHHLLDIAGPGDDFTAGDYSRCARTILRSVSERSKLPVVCGGTGFYLRSLLVGLSPAPQRSEAVRKRLTRIAERRPSSLHYLLRRSDPAIAARIHSNDFQKLIRAIEMARMAAEAASAVQAQPRDELKGYRVLKIGLDPDRNELYARLNRRSAAMFASGLVEETQRLLHAGYGRNSKPMQSLGYAQAITLLAGEITLEDAVAECQMRTRQYAKRQMTWFRREPEVQWLRGFGTDAKIRGEALEIVERFLQK
jgi:tRNA dimethylallyltransferase